MKANHFFLILYSLVTVSLFAGMPTLKTITLDGNPSDWTEVLANPLQVTMDGDGSSMDPALCGTLSTDRDCPVSSVGRDLGTFAWTFDNTYIYIYQTRLGHSSNVQDFWFYMDVGQDQLMNTGDFVLHVKYQGSNRSSSTELWHYAEAGGDPDPMVDLDGWADGYTLPGWPSGYVGSYGDPKAGFSDGTGFETRVPWTDLGIPAGTGIFFHVGSSNGSNLPTQIDDNCGGPDGGIGTFGFYLLDISPDQSASTQPDNTVTFSHIVENTGTFDLSIDMKLASSNGFPLTLRDSSTGDTMGVDANGDGDFNDGGDYLNPACDSNGNGYPDTGSIVPDTQVPIFLDITVPPGTPNLVETAVVTAFNADEGVDDTATDTLMIGDIQVEPDRDLSGTPGTAVFFSHTVIHYLLTDAIQLRAVTNPGWAVTLYTDPEGDGIPNDTMGVDANGDGDYSDPGDSVNPLYDYDSNGIPDTGLLTAATACAFLLEVSIPSGTALNTVCSITLYGSTTTLNGSVLDTAADTLTVLPRLSIEPDHRVADDTNAYGAAGHSVFFPHVVTNAFGAEDTADLSYSASNGATVSFWSDPNCDGSISDGSTIANTGILSANGGSRCIVAEVHLPASLTGGTTVSVFITATSQEDPAWNDTATDEIRISYLVPYEDAVRSTTATRFAHCSTVYVTGYNFQPLDQYTLTYNDPTPLERQLTDTIASGIGRFNDSYTFLDTEYTGSWEIMADDGSVVWDTIILTLEPFGNTNTIDPLSTGRQRYDLLASVGISARLNNTNLGGEYTDSVLKEVILSGDGTLYWDGSAMAPYSGTEWSRISSAFSVNAQSNRTDTFTFPGVDFPTPGVWQVHARWEASCGYEIAEQSVTYLVGTTLESYEDSFYSVPGETFNLHDTVYLSGEYYYPGTSMTVALYDESGTLIDTLVTVSSGTGNLSLSIDTSGWSSEGLIHAVVYLTGTSPSPVYDAGDPDLLGKDEFTLVRLPGLLRNEDYGTFGPAIFVQAYPDDPALDPVADLEKVDFRSLDSFPHEALDLDPSAPALIFYELDKSLETLRLTKQGGRIVINY
ncbi:MAG TPA: hypothetical protein PK014_00245 [Thermoanaerobaculia bacterium]|nr:hypothetical protein [Thermoanaerobaculia bacterium]HXK66901.1 hypothetical protein [Thermoanaerobaculia bacterium]